MRHGRMRTATLDLDLENIEGSHHPSRLDGKLPLRQFGPVVHAKDRFYRVLLQNSLLNHQSRPAFVFLGGLKDEMDGAGEVARFRQVFGRAEKHRRMAVMTASMHA